MIGKHDYLFKGWNMVKEMPQPWVWTHSKPTGTRQIRTRKRLRVYHAWAKPPRAVPTSTPEEKAADPLFAVPGYRGLNLVFKGTIQHAPAEILADTGAIDDFISATYCRANGISFEELGPDEQVPLELGDNTSVTKVIGTTQKFVRIQGLRARVKFLVIDLNDAFSAIIGSATMKQWRAKIDMATDEITLRTQKRTIVLRPDAKGSRLATRTTVRKTPKTKLMTLRQTERWLRKGKTLFLGLVTHESGPPPPIDIDAEIDPDAEGTGPATIDEAPPKLQALLREFEEQL